MEAPNRNQRQQQNSKPSTSSSSSSSNSASTASTTSVRPEVHVNEGGNASSDSENKSLATRVMESIYRQNLVDCKTSSDSIEFEMFNFISDEKKDQSTNNLVPVEPGETAEHHTGRLLSFIAKRRIPEVYEIEEQEATQQRALNRFLPEDFTQKYKCRVCGNDDSRYFLEKKDGVTCLGKNGARDCGTLIQQGYIHIGQEFRIFSDSEDRNTQDSKPFNPLLSDDANYRTTAAGKDKFGKEQAKLEREMMMEAREVQRKYRTQNQKNATTDETKDRECQKYFFQFRDFVRNKRLPEMIVDRSMILFTWIRRYSRKSERLQRAKSYAVACLMIAYYESILTEAPRREIKALTCSFCGLEGFTTQPDLEHHIDFTCKIKKEIRSKGKELGDNNNAQNDTLKKKGLLGQSRIPKESGDNDGENTKSSSWRDLDMMYWDANQILEWLENIGGGAYFFYAAELVEAIKDTVTRLQCSRKNNDSDSMDSDEEEEKQKTNSTSGNQHLGWYLMNKITVVDFTRAFAEIENQEGDNSLSQADPSAINKAREKAVFIMKEVAKEKGNIKKRRQIQAKQEKNRSAAQKDRGKNTSMLQKKLMALTNRKPTSGTQNEEENINNNSNMDSNNSLQQEKTFVAPEESVNASSTSTSNPKRKAEIHEETPPAIRQRTNVTRPRKQSTGPQSSSSSFTTQSSGSKPVNISPNHQIAILQSLFTKQTQLQQVLALPNVPETERLRLLGELQQINGILSQYNIPPR